VIKHRENNNVYAGAAKSQVRGAASEQHGGGARGTGLPGIRAMESDAASEGARTPRDGQVAGASSGPTVEGRFRPRRLDTSSDEEDESTVIRSPREAGESKDDL
jgi:hypothetical protein